VHVVVPRASDAGFAGVGFLLGGQLGLAVAVGSVESVMARLRLPRVPQFLVGASVLAGIGLAALLYRGAP